ncbi:MAG: YraN family protein [Myxococcales bacterium]|nr:YraN family protein [Myxococcales bacterium]USN50147.1 MAG: YraN family protein [Myxococcales bacterium]
MSRKRGQDYEIHAARYLEKQGYAVVARNVSYVFGEIDIIAKDKKTLVFVEVKYRKNDSVSAPFEAVTRSKQRKIIKAAQAYLQNLSFMSDCRFDVISMTGSETTFKIEHIKDAFWDEG